MNSSETPIEDDPRWKLVQRYAEGVASSGEVADLEQTLKQDPEFRAAFLSYLNIDSALEETVLSDELLDFSITGAPKAKKATFRFQIGVGIAAMLIATSLVAFFKPQMFRPVVAEVESATSDVRWLSGIYKEGSSLRKGTRLKLASGSVEVRFHSGAMTRLHAPVQFEIVSANSGFLHYGEAFSRADNEHSQGFTILTHSGNFVDQGTEFLTTASVDGYSQLHVTSGEVDADIPGHQRQRIRTGSGLGIEPGEVPVLIRIEQGEDDATFTFPTIPGPSDADFADRRQGNADVTWRPTNSDDRKNDLSPHSGPPKLLTDGHGQSGKDEPAESLFFRDGANGLIVIDLGKEVPVSKINTYSWHQNLDDPDLRRRAVQRFTLWGHGEDEPFWLLPKSDPSGWTRIARVNTDAFFGVKEEPDRPPQQACSIFSGEEPIGYFRYLLFEVSPTPMPDGLRPRHTFFGEIDVFTNPSSKSKS